MYKPIDSKKKAEFTLRYDIAIDNVNANLLKNFHSFFNVESVIVSNNRRIINLKGIEKVYLDIDKDFNEILKKYPWITFWYFAKLWISSKWITNKDNTSMDYFTHIPLRMTGFIKDDRQGSIFLSNDKWFAKINRKKVNSISNYLRYLSLNGMLVSKGNVSYDFYDELYKDMNGEEKKAKNKADKFFDRLRRKVLE